MRSTTLTRRHLSGSRALRGTAPRRGFALSVAFGVVALCGPAIPAAAQEPDTTQAPTQSPEAGDSPGTGDSPGSSDSPDPSDSPNASDSPGAGDSPETGDSPEAGDSPTDTEPPPTQPPPEDQPPPDDRSPTTDDPGFDPPPLDPSKPAPSGPLTPKTNFKKQQACMQASNGGPPILREPWSQQVFGFERAHAQGITGRGQTVAVIDTGVNRHRWLEPGLIAGGTAVPLGGALTDCDGHGTIVAGIISADTPEKYGFTGIAPESAILSIRQSSALYKDPDTGKTIGNTLTMAQAVKSAVAQGATVINISQASCQSIVSAPGRDGNPQLHNAVKYAYDQGVVVVAAAGNTGGKCKKNPPGNPTTAVLPAWFDKYVLTVASVNKNGAPSKFTVPGPWVDVAAPGEALISLDPGVNADGLATQVSHGSSGRSQPIQGTSFAAPYVSGLAALVMQKYPKLEPGEVMHRIEVTAQHPGGTDEHNDIIGYGMINPMAALKDVVPAEHNAAAAPVEPRRLEAHVFPQENWAAVAVAMGGAIGGLATVLFTAFLINANRRVRAKNAGTPPSKT